VNEAARLLEEHVTDSTDTIDLATVMGLGLAPFRGGIVNYANTIGIEQVVKDLERLSLKHGPHFAPARLLREAAWAHQSHASQTKEAKEAPDLHPGLRSDQSVVAK